MKTYILVFAMPEEKQAFTSLISQPFKEHNTHEELQWHQHRLLLLTTGVTIFNTHKLYPLLLQEKPHEVIQVGTCAGLKNQPIGEVIHATAFFHSDLDLSAFGRPQGWLWKDLPPKKDKPRLVSGSQFLTSPQAIQEIQTRYDADGFDMESFGFFAICYPLNIPFRSIRGVSDNGQENAKEKFEYNLMFAAKKAAEATLDYLKKA